MHSQTNQSSENIFTKKPRTWEQTKDNILPDPILASSNVEEEVTEASKKEEKSFEQFLTRLYAEFDHKITSCKLRCAKKSTGYQSMRQCYGQCEEGLKDYRLYVDNRIDEMQVLLNNCVENAHTLPNPLNEVFYCYILYNRGFPHLKWMLKQESSYYE